MCELFGFSSRKKRRRNDLLRALYNIRAEVPHGLAVVERMLHAGDLLRSLVALAGYDHDVAALRAAERQPYGCAPVRLHRDPSA